MKYCIIQPATWEGVQSGVCFTPYWLYAGLREKGFDVHLYEDVPLRGFKWIPTKEYDRVWILFSTRG